MKRKFKIPVGKLFEFFGQLDAENEVPIEVNRYLTIQNQNNEFKQINYLVKKRGYVNTYILESGITIKCDEKHLVKQNGEFCHIKDATTVDTIYGNKKVINVIPDSIKNVYDFSIDAPHEYITASGVICHNTSLAKIIASNTDSDLLYINASDENSIDNVRHKIKSFAQGVSISAIKLVILDEVDFMTQNAQAALRNIMETYSNTTRFILTANYQEKLLDAIVSRCCAFEIFPPSEKEVALHAIYILTEEDIKYTDPNEVLYLVNQTYPDLRLLINELQNNSIDGELKINKAGVFQYDLKYKILEELKSNAPVRTVFNNIRQLVNDNKISDFTDIYSFIYKNIDEFKNIEIVILTLAEGLKTDAFVVDKEINFMATITNILNAR